ARLAYISGFTGSAGYALVTADKAALFVDSRYTLQAPAQTDTNVFAIDEFIPGTPSPVLSNYISEGATLAYDPWLHTPGEVRGFVEALKGYAKLVPHDNLVDTIWADRPAAPVSPIEFLGHNRAGKTAQDKLADLRKTLR